MSQRLARLSTGTTALLELAAVAGPEFDLSGGRGAGLADADLHAALEQAIAHGMIEEVPSRRLAYRFTHELVRRALYDGCPGCAAPSCTCTSPRRWNAAARTRRQPGSPSWLTTSARRPRSTARGARSSTRSWPAGRR